MRGVPRVRGTRRDFSAAASTASTIRCAIYTRKSTDEGLDKEFNSLQAQRESGEAYVASQRHEGWICLPDHYDDGGFSGANMDRPALKRLVADVDAGKVDCIIVYKIDRLSRSLLDFARMVEVLDRHRVFLVSISQQFNTSTPMGRMFRNLLMTFAEFERETIAERVRDKMGAARRKGKWIGGIPILGYDVHPTESRLLVNPTEAPRVRTIFELYLEKESLTDTVRELHRRGWATKSWTTKKGRIRKGAPFNKTKLHRLLTNPTYLGQVHFQGATYPGEQAAILDEGLWTRVREVLRSNARAGAAPVRNRYGALLKGLLACQPCGASMIHTYTIKGPRCYRYYVCDRAQKEGWDSCPTKSLPASEIEQFVVDQIRRIGSDRRFVAETTRRAAAEGEERRRELEKERIAAEKELSSLGNEMKKLAGSADLGRPAGSTSTSNLADIQDRTRSAEQRLTSIRECLIALDRERIDQRELATALGRFDPVWDSLSLVEKTRVLQLLVDRIGYDGGSQTLDLRFRPSGIKALAAESTPGQPGRRRVAQ